MKYVVSIAGIYYAEVPPVPIPNTEVKLSGAESFLIFNVEIN